MVLANTPLNTFKHVFDKACECNPMIEVMCSPASDLDGKDCRLFTSNASDCGFVIHPDGELTHLFSAGKGNGAYLVAAAIALGAKRLDCFDGYLVKLYKSKGFKEVRREPNWTQGEPDVVFMELTN